MKPATFGTRAVCELLKPGSEGGGARVIWFHSQAPFAGMIMVYVRICIEMNECVCVCMCIYTLMYIYIHIYVYAYTYVYIYIFITSFVH